MLFMAYEETLIIPFSVSFYSELRNAITIYRECYILQAKSFIFYNVQTRYWTSISKNSTHEEDVIELHNSK